METLPLIDRMSRAITEATRQGLQGSGEFSLTDEEGTLLGLYKVVDGIHFLCFEEEGVSYEVDAMEVDIGDTFMLYNGIADEVAIPTVLARDGLRWTVGGSLDPNDNLPDPHFETVIGEALDPLEECSRFSGDHFVEYDEDHRASLTREGDYLHLEIFHVKDNSKVLSTYLDMQGRVVWSCKTPLQKRALSAVREFITDKDGEECEENSLGLTTRIHDADGVVEFPGPYLSHTFSIKQKDGSTLTGEFHAGGTSRVETWVGEHVFVDIAFTRDYHVSFEGTAKGGEVCWENVLVYHFDKVYRGVSFNFLPSFKVSPQDLRREWVKRFGLVFEGGLSQGDEDHLGTFWEFKEVGLGEERLRRDYCGVGRRTFLVEQLPDPEFREVHATTQALEQGQVPSLHTLTARPVLLLHGDQVVLSMPMRFFPTTTFPRDIFSGVRKRLFEVLEAVVQKSAPAEGNFYPWASLAGSTVEIKCHDHSVWSVSIGKDTLRISSGDQFCWVQFGAGANEVRQIRVGLQDGPYRIQGSVLEGGDGVIDVVRSEEHRNIVTYVRDRENELFRRRHRVFRKGFQIVESSHDAADELERRLLSRLAEAREALYCYRTQKEIASRWLVTPLGKDHYEAVYSFGSEHMTYVFRVEGTSPVELDAGDHGYSFLWEHGSQKMTMRHADGMRHGLQEYTHGSRQRRYYYDLGCLSREDGPAVETEHSQQWYLDGIRGRDDGPAYISSKGEEIWYQSGLRHRETGPAHLDPSRGTKDWYLCGQKIFSPGTEFPQVSRAWDTMSAEEVRDVYVGLTPQTTTFRLVPVLGDYSEEGETNALRLFRCGDQPCKLTCRIRGSDDLHYLYTLSMYDSDGVKQSEREWRLPHPLWKAKRDSRWGPVLRKTGARGVMRVFEEIIPVADPRLKRILGVLVPLALTRIPKLSHVAEVALEAQLTAEGFALLQKLAGSIQGALAPSPEPLPEASPLMLPDTRELFDLVDLICAEEGITLHEMP